MPEADYYVRRRRLLLRMFDRVAGPMEASVAARYGAAEASAVMAETRAEFDRLLPELPYIGGWRNLFTGVMVVNGWLLGLHRALQRRGRPAAETIAVASEVADGMFLAVPTWLRGPIARAAFGRLARRLLRKQAARSQERRYSEDFVYRLREGDGDDFALEFDECAVNKLYKAQGTTELAPYCNFFDVTYSRILDMGCDATETIGLGCTTCRLRYKHGRATPIPEQLAGVLPRTGG